ncbi:hypothetical protein BaRGS_00033591 [Batillaria attramentaria]|uniref:Uncharacterized protein n=1 Tax=Batillaria attramentaria TaxID=370345 RepID=A0ABD0JJR7_9CAEN
MLSRQLVGGKVDWEVTPHCPPQGRVYLYGGYVTAAVCHTPGCVTPDLHKTSWPRLTDRGSSLSLSTLGLWRPIT